MITYMVQRKIEGIGLSGAPGRDLAMARSTEGMAYLAPRIEWCHTWLSADSLLSLYRAISVSDVLEHAQRAQVPVGNIARVLTEISGDGDEWYTLLDIGQAGRKQVSTS